MGMVAAGTIDLMASPFFDLSELGKIREVFIRGQRLGRIGNLISTYAREMEEGDMTNEIMLSLLGPNDYCASLMEEMRLGLNDLRQSVALVKSIDLIPYVKGLNLLRGLHERMEGII